MPIVPEYHSSLVYFFSGALSEVVISGITVPAETVKCRLQLGRNPHNATGGAIKSKTNYRNTFHAAKSIFRAEGVRGFYGAYSACLSVDTIQSGFSFLFYETVSNFPQKYWTSCFFA
jgi:hypothetical protein